MTGAADPLVPVEDTMEGKLPQRKITVTADSLTDADSFSLTALWIYDEEDDKNVSVDIEEFEAAEKDGATFTFEITPDEALTAGDYTIAFRVNGVRFSSRFTVE